MRFEFSEAEEAQATEEAGEIEGNIHYLYANREAHAQHDLDLSNHLDN